MLIFDNRSAQNFLLLTGPQLKKGCDPCFRQNMNVNYDLNLVWIWSFIKVNLHSIRFSYVFVRFFTFLVLLDKVCAFSSAFLCVHIRTNQTVTYWTKVFRKKIFVKGYSSISKYRSYRSCTKFLNKIFIYI